MGSNEPRGVAHRLMRKLVEQRAFALRQLRKVTYMVARPDQVSLLAAGCPCKVGESQRCAELWQVGEHLPRSSHGRLSGRIGARIACHCRIGATLCEPGKKDLPTARRRQRLGRAHRQNGLVCSKRSVVYETATIWRPESGGGMIHADLIAGSFRRVLTRCRGGVQELTATLALR